LVLLTFCFGFAFILLSPEAGKTETAGRLDAVRRFCPLAALFALAGGRRENADMMRFHVYRIAENADGLE